MKLWLSAGMGWFFGPYSSFPLTASSLPRAMCVYLLFYIVIPPICLPICSWLPFLVVYNDIQENFLFPSFLFSQFLWLSHPNPLPKAIHLSFPSSLFSLDLFSPLAFWNTGSGDRYLGFVWTTWSVPFYFISWQGVCLLVWSDIPVLFLWFHRVWKEIIMPCLSCIDLLS